MQLLDLPPELFKDILDLTVVAVGVLPAFELRLVNKRFSMEVPRSMVATKLLDDCPVHLHECFLEIYFTGRVIADGTRKDNVAGIIHRTATMMAAEESSPEHESSHKYVVAKYVQRLCVAQTKRLFSVVMIGRLKPTPQQTRTASSAMVEFALSTAVYYQLPDQLTHWLKKAEEAPQVNSQFADALRFAVRLGHDAMVEMILDYAATRNLEWVDEQLRSERYHLEDPDLSEVRRIDTLSPYHGLYMVGIEAALFFRRDNTMQSIVEHLVAEIERSGPALSLVI